jgi:aminoglycoside 6'-N-acetyltransferase
MNISFKPLSSSDFPKLLEWLNAPHVNKWWDKGFNWTIEAVKEKYEEYIKSEDINCYIIETASEARQSKWIASQVRSYKQESSQIPQLFPIGLIQTYKVDKFPPAKHKAILPANLWGVDMFIGEELLLGKGIGTTALKLFIEKHADFEYLLIDPHKDNIAAIKAYQKCGFQEIARDEGVDEVWMIRKK